MKNRIAYGSRWICVPLFALISASAGAQDAKQPSPSERALIETNATVMQALQNGDSTVLPALLAVDLVYTDASGAPQSRAQLLSAVSRGYRAKASRPSDLKAHVDGNLGLLGYQTTYATATGDSAVIRYSAVYVMRAGHWQLTSLSSTGGPVVAAVAPAPPPLRVTPPVITPPVRGSTPTPTTRMDRMTARATGTFEPDVKPLTAYNTFPAAMLGRMSIDKRFHGGLDATSKGEMLSAGTAVKGSAGYVAVEYVTGSLNGKKGSFALQHTGTMNRGVPSLSVTVVPDSGTGELSGLTGTMNIVIENGKHSYTFDYSLTGGL